LLSWSAWWAWLLDKGIQGVGHVEACLSHCAYPYRFLIAKRLAIIRATIVKASTITINVNAAPHARSTAGAKGDEALRKICEIRICR
jgi:hypothetical protein